MRQAFLGKEERWGMAEALIEGIATWELGYAQLADAPALPEGARLPVVTVAVDAAQRTTAAPEKLIQLSSTMIAPSLRRALLARNKSG